jgi:hypothetical protein
MANLATDILNPDVGSELNPDYGFALQRPKSRVSYRPRNSRPLERQVDSQPHVIQLLWQNRPSAVAKALLQWEQQYEDGYFQYFDAERSRYYAGRFMEPLTIAQTAFEKCNIQGVFEELVGALMFEYPDDWDNDAIFVDEQNDWGDIVWGVQGAWVRTANALARGGFELLNAAPVNTDFAKLQYFGYGFKLWLSKGPNRGQCAIYVDDVLYVANLDLYSAAAAPAQPLVIDANLPIGIHSVKILALAAKNGASSSTAVVADAIQVMR